MSRSLQHRPQTVSKSSASYNVSFSQHDNKNTNTPSRNNRISNFLPLRCMGWIALSVGVGYVLFFACASTFRAEATRAIQTHFLSGASMTVAWLALVTARLPSLALLAVAGMTRFSGALTSAILCYRGLCDGVAFATVLNASGNLISSHIQTIFLLWMLSGLVLHLMVAISSRLLAAFCATEPDKPPQSTPPPVRSALRYRIWRHATVSVAVVAACIVSSLAYCALLF